MKRIVLIISLFAFTGMHAFSQQEDKGNDKIREKMSEFIQQRMNLSKAEAEKFNPIFLRYFREWRNTLKENKNDKLILQQRIVELRLKYRNEFKDVIGEKRSNDVYKQQEIFIRELRQLKQDRQHDKPDRPLKNLRQNL
ncbi:MAG TPA: hypothetical protein VIQ00_16930 [Chitinophagaceae bacterium]|jgi:hypothetical protein